jgi:hypothetical protein
MTRTKLLRPLLIVASVATLALSLGGGANAALVKVGDLVLQADGSFKPSKLPRHSFAPINLFGRADIHLTTGAPPPALTEVNLDFDRDGRLSTAGLPQCSLDQIRTATTQQARSRCKGAIVGEGVVGAFVERDGVKVEVNEPATLFNGPRSDGNATVIGHVHANFPTPRTYVLSIPIEKRRGAYAYRAHIDVPQIAENGVLSHIDGRIGRRYVYRGKSRSYVSAKCSAGVLRLHGHFLFADEDATVIDGAIEKACYPEPR